MLLPSLPRWVICFSITCIARKGVTQKECFPFGNKTVQSEKQYCLFILIPLSTNLISSLNNITTWPDSANGAYGKPCRLSMFFPLSLILANFLFHFSTSNQFLFKLFRFLSKCIFIIGCVWCAKLMPHVLEPYRNVAWSGGP